MAAKLAAQQGMEVEVKEHGSSTDGWKVSQTKYGLQDKVLTFSLTPNQQTNQGVTKKKKAASRKQKERKEAAKMKAVGFAEQLQNKSEQRVGKVKKRRGKEKK